MSIFVEMKFQIDLKILFKTRKREKKNICFQKQFFKKEASRKKMIYF